MTQTNRPTVVPADNTVPSNTVPSNTVPSNTVLLRGLLSSRRSTHALPDGLHRHSHTLRSVPDTDERWSVPVVIEGPATHESDGWGDDIEVLVVGDVRQRFFRSGSATVSRTEVVGRQIIPVRRRRQVERALDEVRRSLGAA